MCNVPYVVSQLGTLLGFTARVGQVVEALQLTATTKGGAGGKAAAPAEPSSNQGSAGMCRDGSGGDEREASDAPWVLPVGDDDDGGGGGGGKGDSGRSGSRPYCLYTKAT